MHNLDLILTLTSALAAAVILGYIAHRLRLPPLIGYLLAGIAVGPHTPGFVANRELAEQLAEIGVILLMFGVGLHFHIRDLLSVRTVAVPGALGQSFIATLLGAVAGWAFGWGWGAGVVYGLALSVASTVVLIRVLSDHDDLHTPTGRIAVGWLVVEDVFTVAVLVILPAVFGAQAGGLGRFVGALALAAAKIVLLVAIALLVGDRVIPWMLDRVAATRSRELFTLTILVVALGLAVGSATLFGVSMALGAFLAGMVVGRSEFSLRAASEALPMRDAFAVLFFVSIGMLFDPRFLFQAPIVAAVTIAIVLIGKPLAAIAIVWFLRYPPKVAFAVAAALAQIGEFSFILATVGKALGILPDSASNGLVAAAIVSVSINATLYRQIDGLAAWLSRRPRVWRWLNARVREVEPAKAGAPLPVDEDYAVRHRAVVVGYGPVGRTLTRLLRENDIEPTVIDMNLDTTRKLREQGASVAYGDARQRETLLAAGVHRAGSLILTVSDIGGEEIIRLARELNPTIRIVARSTYVGQRAGLRRAGADRVFAGEAEVALAMTESILRELGATHEQIDRERDRVRADLFENAHRVP
jgi:CPA2 family monovalent cation:H+ antiporter-2